MQKVLLRGAGIPISSGLRVSGARTYTVQYAYDAQGRLTTETTKPGAAEQQTTTWPVLSCAQSGSAWRSLGFLD